MRCLLLFEDNLILVQLGELAHNLRHKQADLDLPLAGPVLSTVVLGDIGDFGQCLGDAVLYLLLLGVDVVCVVL